MYFAKSKHVFRQEVVHLQPDSGTLREQRGQLEGKLREAKKKYKPDLQEEEHARKHRFRFRVMASNRRRSYRESLQRKKRSVSAVVTLCRADLRREQSDLQRDRKDLLWELRQLFELRRSEAKLDAREK